MNLNDEKSKARRTRRVQKEDDSHGDSNRTRESGSDRSADGVQRVGGGGEVGERADQHRPRNPTTGGMLSQLIEEGEDQLAEIEEEMQRLQRRREKLLARRDRYQEMLGELQQRIQDNP
ncbi:MAG: hypothetical protein HC878_03565 [Leptolyngbyaceae cyanobacterium SL_5_14]|nr:hypothetical protein [Leptolyngbyaceae cyanobacterium SL_5_14]NJO66159.1 hypothetical protein [Leptolyngbyaceae cyanobacterium RM1_405_57]